MPTLKSLYTYPIKSTAALPLQEAAAEPLGLEHDRRWMVVRPDGTFITGRQEPSLVRVQARPVAGGLHLSAPGLPDLEVAAPPEDGPRMDVAIWKDKCSAARAGAEAEAWLSRYLGQEVALVYVDSRTERPVDARYASPGDKVAFSDGFPILVFSEASLAELNQRLPRPVTQGHFRPNLVVEGCEAFAEDGWKRLRIGTVELAVVKPCERCVFTTVDPETGVKDKAGEPLRTLAGFRRISGKVLFGQNVLVVRPGRMRVGDEVEVLG